MCNIAQQLQGRCNRPEKIFKNSSSGLFFYYFCAVEASKSGIVTVTSDDARIYLRVMGGLRFGNNANNSKLSARYLNAHNSAGNTNSYYCGSAKV